MKIEMMALAALLLLSGCEKKAARDECPADFKKKEREKAPTKAQLRRELAALDEMLSGPCTPACCEKYIEEVVNEGSDALNMPSSPMDAGFAGPEDAKKIAAFTVTLSGKKSPHPEWVQEGSLLFGGNCAGCHGSDGKGQGGAFPDLTLPELKGMTLRKKAMARRAESIREQLAH